MNTEKLKFPIGQFVKPEPITEKHIEQWIADLGLFPYKIDNLTSRLDSQQLQLPYKPGGWTIKQLVHHCADSHLNVFIRFKSALTEHIPVIKPYDQNKWIELADSQDNDITASLSLIETLHYKWIVLLKSLNGTQWKRQFFHPENGRIYVLEEVLGAYAWHGNHHIAHIEQALAHKGIF